MDEFKIQTDLNQIEDLLLEAQDAYFMGNLQQTIELCSSILSMKSEPDAYDLICISLLEIDPPRYSECLKYALEWNKNCGETPKQISLILRVAYLADNKELVSIFASKILSQTETESKLNVKKFLI